MIHLSFTPDQTQSAHGKRSSLCVAASKIPTLWSRTTSVQWSTLQRTGTGAAKRGRTKKTNIAGCAGTEPWATTLTPSPASPARRSSAGMLPKDWWVRQVHGLGGQRRTRVKEYCLWSAFLLSFRIPPPCAPLRKEWITLCVCLSVPVCVCHLAERCPSFVRTISHLNQRTLCSPNMTASSRAGMSCKHTGLLYYCQDHREGADPKNTWLVIWWHVKWITWRQSKVCVQPWCNSLWLTGLKAPTYWPKMKSKKK